MPSMSSSPLAASRGRSQPCHVLSLQVAGHGLELDLLGAFRVRHGGAELAQRLSSRSQALVAFIVLRAEGTDRSQLAGTLWPGSAEGQALTNLRKALYELRHEVPPLYDCVATAGHGLAWRPGSGVRVDVVEFRSFAALPTLGSLQKARVLYRGPLMPALSDIWLVEQREALHLEHQRVLRALVALYSSRGELRQALESAEALARADPLADEPHLRLFELAAGLGERGLLESAWQRHRRSLEELDLEPSPAVALSYQKARAAPGNLPGPPAQPAGPARPGGPRIADGPRLFGRNEQLEQFRRWVATGTTRALVVTGVPGVGKSALVAAFGRELAREGRPFMIVDGEQTVPAPAAFWRVLGVFDHAGALEWANRRRAVLLFDNFEDMGLLGRYLADQFLPALGAGARLVVSARSAHSQPWPWGSPGRALVHQIELPGLDKADALEYLAYRGVSEKVVAASVVGRIGVTPLALSLAADLVLGMRPGPVWSSPQWREVIAGLLAVWLRHVRDDDLRELVAASSVVRDFDQEMLSALAGRPVGREEFVGLARLPGVRVTESGLSLHDDFRRFLAEDLNWRTPERGRRLRLSALDEYQRRLGSATPRTRQRIAAEQLFLSEDAILQDLLFCPEEEGQVYTERGRPEQVDELERVLHSWGDQRMDLPRPHQMVAATRAIFAYRGTLLRVVRRQGEGTIVGLAAVVPICKESVELLLGHPGIEPYVRSRWAGSADLPMTHEQSAFFHFTHAAYREDLGDTSRAARARLLREMIGLLARGGTYSLSTPDLEYQALAETLGFRRVTEVRHALYGRHHVCEHYELNLTEQGFAGWVNALLSPGLRPEQGTAPRRGQLTVG